MRPKRVTCILFTYIFGALVSSVCQDMISWCNLSSLYAAHGATTVSSYSSEIQINHAGYSLSGKLVGLLQQLITVDENEQGQPVSQQIERTPLPIHKKYALIKTGPARVLKELNPKSPILGMAKRGSHYPLLKAGDSWCTILYKDQEGWVERMYIDIIDAPSSSRIVVKEFLVIIGIVIGVGLIIFLIYTFSSRSNKIKGEWFTTTAADKKKIVIVSRAETQVQRLLTNNITPLEKCFSEIGFEVKNSQDSDTTMKLIYHYLPDAIAVDWRLGKNTQAVIEQILASKSFTNNMFVLFYNVSNPDTVEPSTIIPNVHYLGISFTDRDLFNIITPIIITGEKSHTIRKSIESSALQGNIQESKLSDVFQFIEIGRKKGCLLIEDDKKPIGIVYFNDGIIIYGATRQNTEKKAVFEILDFQSGQFYFVLDKEPKSSNCSVPIVGILMEWTKETDETSGNRLRST